MANMHQVTPLCLDDVLFGFHNFTDRPVVPKKKCAYCYLRFISAAPINLDWNESKCTDVKDGDYCSYCKSFVMCDVSGCTTFKAVNRKCCLFHCYNQYGEILINVKMHIDDEIYRHWIKKKLPNEVVALFKRNCNIRLIAIVLQDYYRHGCINNVELTTFAHTFCCVDCDDENRCARSWHYKDYLILHALLLPNEPTRKNLKSMFDDDIDD